MKEIFLNVLEYTPFFFWAIVLIVGMAFESTLTPGRVIDKEHRSSKANLINGVVVSVMTFIYVPAVSAMIAKVVALCGGGLIDVQMTFKSRILCMTLSLFLFTFIYDFFYYWLHRAQHRYLFLWHIHALHHSDTDFNVTTYARQHWLEMLLQSILISAPIAVIFKFTPFDFFVGAMFLAGWSFFTHMNIRLDMGRATSLLAGPQYHRLHHSIEKKHMDVNFSQYFPIFDVLFKTYYKPEKDEYPLTGIYTGENAEGPVGMFMWPFRKYGEAFRAYRLSKRKIMP